MYKTQNNSPPPKMTSNKNSIKGKSYSLTKQPQIKNLSTNSQYSINMFKSLTLYRCIHAAPILVKTEKRSLNTS